MIAEELVANFDKAKASIEKIEIAGPGFINFYMDNSYLTDLIPTIVSYLVKLTVKRILVKVKKYKLSSYLRIQQVTFT